MLSKIYLLHHKDELFKNRYDYITNRLSQENLEFELIDLYKPEEIDYDEMTKNQDFIPIFIEQINGNSYFNFSKKISKASLSLILKHLYCWKDQIKNNYDYILVLEDDSEIPDNFSELLDNIVNEMRIKESELVMIGTAFDLKSPNILKDNFIHFNYLQKTRCTHAYIISKSCSEKMINGFKNYNLPIDFKMNEVIQLEKIKVYWYEPGIKQKIF
jgi:GR25 family glycosyltransferase involved in LPS biosynthesis